MFDVIVIGVGSMGAAACWQLSKRGANVLGLEQFDLPHDFGSHFGQSRIIRKAYFEHPDYVPLLEQAYASWDLLEKETGSTVFYRTGIVYYGEPDNPLLEGTRLSARLYGIPVEEWDVEEARKRYPGIQSPEYFQVLFEPDAGFVLPERATTLFVEQSIRQGATIRTREKVLEWEAGPGEVRVRTDRGRYTAAHLVFTAGAWTQKLVSGLGVPLKVTRQVLGWVHPPSWDMFSMGHFPCWFIGDKEGGNFYGFPVVPTAQVPGPPGFKLARHFPGRETDPDQVDRTVTLDDEEEFRYVLRKYMPSANGNTLSVKTCLYTYTPDEHFIIDLLPGSYNRVSVACGFSGHGFKFASVVGEILADLAMRGETGLPAGFLKLDRFQVK